MSERLPVIFSLSALLLLHCEQATGFATWLKCYVDITDTEEIIMNYLILPKDQGQYGEAQIEVKGIDDDHWVTEDFYFDPLRSNTIMARLKVSPVLEERDVQFVMEVLPNDGTTNENVKFSRPANVCKGKRAHAAHHVDSVVIEIPPKEDDAIASPVRLIAVYATGHEAVTQTDILILQPLDIEEEL